MFTKTTNGAYFSNVPMLLIDACQIIPMQKGVTFFIIKIRPNMRLPITNK
jgi:hypothetical protein